MTFVRKSIPVLLLVLVIKLVVLAQKELAKQDPRETHEKRLLKNLFQNYDKEVRPVLKKNDSVNVEFSLSLIQIISVNSKSQLVTISVWIRQKWKNPFMSWNASDYGGIDVVNLNPERLWIPDVILYDNADETYAGGLEKYKTSVIVYSDGTNEWNSPASFTSTCKINVKYFPFDKQKCSLKFGSWTYMGDRLTMTSASDSADLSMYVNNGEWHLLQMPAVLNKVFYNCCKFPFYDVTLHLIIKRKPLYYVFNLILPCALIATLTLIKFFLPPESGEKVGLGITVLLAMTVFLLLVAETLPSTSDNIPLLGQYFVATMFVTAVSLVVTCIILNFFHRNPATSPMPRWVKVIILDYMARVFCFGVFHEEESKIRPKKRKSRIDLDVTLPEGELGMDDLVSLREIDSSRTAKFSRMDSLHYPSGRSTPCRRSISMMSTNNHINSLTERLLEDINILADDVREKQEDERLREEWRCAALVLDRMFFWIMSVVSILTSFLIFYREPVLEG
ncbi:neuronal acetylcholine receptor subunit alpha-10 [Exaiptasia diaphana]|uniref:Uncharacterized protein n=1 Tax=Exaiptasia diaphana TaxID=2652724 RepID=A0A913X7Y8_EXADI|nr:neuronal acetylcholine receptor subunit alpha-10 [Exaiptasia diaphana]XP_020909072.1 neuronal acetylcholine receptor subunit alpha-10 [Exaiptasia diaphana]KXJ09443.1 Neuronal acetylcholine receptor subunit alpha-10 [Exaiptasia diaphana]